jgi:hypothetical protein
VVGCGGAPVPAGTGAEQAAQAYFEALLRQDWAGGYSCLHPDSRARLGPEQFANLARNHLRHFGFEPRAIHVRSCEERDTEATAHVAFTGRSVGHQRFYRDAVTLRKSAEGWGILLPPRFGLIP